MTFDDLNARLQTVGLLLIQLPTSAAVAKKADKPLHAKASGPSHALKIKIGRALTRVTGYLQKGDINAAAVCVRGSRWKSSEMASLLKALSEEGISQDVVLKFHDKIKGK
jgi:Tfp pilus assembly protein PilF